MRRTFFVAFLGADYNWCLWNHSKITQFTIFVRGVWWVDVKFWTIVKRGYQNWTSAKCLFWNVSFSSSRNCLEGSNFPAVPFYFDHSKGFNIPLAQFSVSSKGLHFWSALFYCRPSQQLSQLLSPNMKSLHQLLELLSLHP